MQFRISCGLTSFFFASYSMISFRVRVSLAALLSKMRSTRSARYCTLYLLVSLATFHHSGLGMEKKNRSTGESASDVTACVGPPPSASRPG